MVLRRIEVRGRPRGRRARANPLNNGDPETRFAYALRRIADTPQTQLAELLPSN
jgi:hypothetical protein